MHRLRPALVRTLPIVLGLMAVAAACSPVGGGSSSASGSSSAFPSDMVVLPYCSIAGGPVRVTISANAEPIPVSVVYDVTSLGNTPAAWATGSSPVPVGGGTIISEALRPGACGFVAMGIRLGDCGFPPCTPRDFSFDYRVSW